MRFTDFLTEKSIRPSLQARNETEVLYELGGMLARRTQASPVEIGSLLLERESISSTAIPGGVALPHCRLQALPRIITCVGLHHGGLAFGRSEHGRVRIFVGVASPMDAAGQHLGVLSRVVGMLRDPRLREALLSASTASSIFSLLVQAEEAYAARLTPREHLVLAGAH
jgi:PTS system nitrogen regulatory IIA component